MDWEASGRKAERSGEMAGEPTVATTHVDEALTDKHSGKGPAADKHADEPGLAEPHAARPRAPEARVAGMLREADAVVIAASNGFDIADGYNQFACDQAFLRTFGDFNRAYGLQSIIQGLAARWPSAESRWAFLARAIDYGYASYQPSPVMRTLDALTAGKPRFVVTCNCNGRFERAGFDPDALFETEGSYARLRCSAGCTDEDYDAEPFVAAIFGTQVGTEAPTSVLPRCPRCGALLDIAVDDTGRLAATARFRAQQERCDAFLEAHRAENVLVMELGVGQRNPAIKRPLMAYAQTAPHARYAVFSRDPAVLPAGMDERAVAVQGDLAAALAEVAARLR